MPPGVRRTPALLLSLVVLAALVVAGVVAALPRSAGPAADPISLSAAGTFTFAAVGDLGATADTRAVLDSVATSDASMMLALGDLAYDDVSTEEKWCAQLHRKLGASFPVELIAGNHESAGRDGSIDAFARCAPNRLPGLTGLYGRQWFADVPSGAPLARFILISPALSFGGTPWSYATGTPRHTWLVNAITDARQRGIGWIVVGMHKNCLEVGKYSCEVGQDLMTTLLDLKVDLVLQGHTHHYLRSHQLSTGSGCASWVPDTYDADCVVDRDADLVRGAGTVVVTSGVGGHSIYPANTSERDMPYVAALSAENYSAANGPLLVTVGADRLAARFVSSSRGPFTDAFSIQGPARPATAGTATVVAASDTEIRSDRPSVSGGAATSVWTDADPTRTALLRFDTSAIAGRTVTGAHLEVRSSASRSAGTTGSVQVRAVTPPWTQAATWSTRPVIGTVALGSFRPTTPTAWTRIRLDPAAVDAMTGDDLSLALVASSGDGAGFVTAEGRSPARLVLVTTP